MADITGEVEKATEAAKKHWWVFLLAAFILIAWVLSDDIKNNGKWTSRAAKWPIIGPYFFKNTALAPGASAGAAS
jgi:hypothetical protein